MCNLHLQFDPSDSSKHLILEDQALHARTLKRTRRSAFFWIQSLFDCWSGCDQCSERGLSCSFIVTMDNRTKMYLSEHCKTDGTLFVEGVSETSGHAVSLPSFLNEYPMLLPMMLSYKLVKQKGLAMLSHCHQIHVLLIMWHALLLKLLFIQCLDYSSSQSCKGARMLSELDLHSFQVSAYHLKNCYLTWSITTMSSLSVQHFHRYLSRKLLRSV